MRVASQAAVAPAAAADASAAAAAFTFAELFAGIGGFRLGLEPLGGRCVFASEIDPHACATYERNFGEAPSGDITEIPSEALPPSDIVTGGFPCQSFAAGRARRAGSPTRAAPSSTTSCASRRRATPRR